jgi:hypothetical protein
MTQQTEVENEGHGQGTVLDDAMNQPAEKAVDVSYDDLKLPEGLSLNDEDIQKHKDMFKSLGLSKEAAEHWLKDKSDATKSAVEKALSEQEAKRKAEWSAKQEEQKAEINKAFGDKLKDKQAAIMTALDKFMPKDDREAFTAFQRETGLGNNPVFVKFMAAIGESLKDANVSGGGVPTPQKQPMYPNSNMVLD